MPRIDRPSILKQSMIFSGLDRGELESLARLAAERSFKSGEAIFWEGDPPEYFYVVAEGRVKVLKHSSTGKDFILAFFGPGEMFGEVAVFEDRPYPASSEAAMDTTVLGFRRQDLLSFLAAHPKMALAIIDVLAGRLRDSQSRLKDMSVERVEQRLTRTLFMLYSRLGGTLPFTRQEIADMSGTTTETAIRIMGRLRERGIIRSVRGKIIILDETKLRLLADGPPNIP